MLGTLGGRYSYAQAVNDAGMIVGSSTDRAGYLKAFAWNGGFVSIGTLGGTTSAAYDVNSGGDVVGFAADSSGRNRAFLWRGGMLFDLNSMLSDSGEWTLETAYCINDRGQIVGAGIRDGRATGFILDPVALVSSHQRGVVNRPGDPRRRRGVRRRDRVRRHLAPR